MRTLAPPYEALENPLRHEAILSLLSRDESRICQVPMAMGNLSAYFTLLFASALGNSESDIDSADTGLAFCARLPDLPAVSWERFG
jgi:hypothetical protein